MPFVIGFDRVETTRSSRQPTDVVAIYKIIQIEGGEELFQIDTGGSAHRENPGKQSQTFQLNRQSAEVLWRLLGDQYGFR